jgi:hypothetical protein
MEPLDIQPVEPLDIQPVEPLDVQPLELPVENAQHPSLSTMDRWWVQNVAPDEESAAKWLDKKGWISRVKDGEVHIRQPHDQKWHKVEAYWSPELSDVGDIINEVFGGAAMAAGASAGGVLGAGAGAAGAEAARRGLAASQGFEQTLPEAIAGTVEEGVLGAGFEAGGRIVGKGLKALKGKIWPKAAPGAPAAEAGEALFGRIPAFPAAKPVVNRVARVGVKPKGAPSTFVPPAASPQAAQAAAKGTISAEEWEILKSQSPEFAAKLEAQQAAGQVWEPTAESTGEEILKRTRPSKSFESLKESYYRNQDAAMKKLGGKVPQISEWQPPAEAMRKPYLWGFKDKDQAERYIYNVAKSEENLDHLLHLMDVKDVAGWSVPKKVAYLSGHYKELERAVIDPRVSMVKLVTKATEPAGGRAYAEPIEVTFRKRGGDMRTLVGTTRFPPSGLPKTKTQILDEVTDKALTTKQFRDRVLKYTNQGRPISKADRRRILKADIPELASIVWGYQKGAFKNVGMNYNPKQFGLLVMWDIDKKLFRMIDTEFVSRVRTSSGKTFRMDDLKNLVDQARSGAAYKIGKGLQTAGHLMGTPERIARRGMERAMSEVGVEKMGPGVGKTLTTLGAYGLGGFPGVAMRWTPDIMEGIGRRLMRDPDWAGTKIVNMVGKIAETGGWDRLAPYLYTASRNDPRLRNYIEDYLNTGKE